PTPRLHNTRGSTSRTAPPEPNTGTDAGTGTDTGTDTGTAHEDSRRQREPEGRSPARTRRQGGAQRTPRQARCSLA
ncbi:MAG: hypothetical protein WBN29_09220, partial [Polyangiales bacterium]